MDRVIKFRGQTLEGKWVYGNLTILKEKTGNLDAGYYISNSVGMPFAYQIRPETVGQFTGLTDKNGLTELFEYDIIDKNGVKKGNYYENEEILKDKTNLLITRMGCEEWRNTEQEAIKRGCKYAK